jgi:hypothetical protein
MIPQVPFRERFGFEHEKTPRLSCKRGAFTSNRLAQIQAFAEGRAAPLAPSFTVFTVFSVTDVDVATLRKSDRNESRQTERLFSRSGTIMSA